jgi:hypothetical protein
MRLSGNRDIKVKKFDLIEKIKKNKENHIKEYDKAVVAYKEEALRQLGKLTLKVNEGGLDVKLDLITPVNNADNYDKILEMFEWEVEDEVVLEQDEFKEYVQDEFDFAVSAKFSNSVYLNQI